MGKKDHRDKEDKDAWEKGRITPQEARDAGGDVDEMNRIREEQERKLGNPLAPPE